MTANTLKIIESLELIDVELTAASGQHFNGKLTKEQAIKMISLFKEMEDFLREEKAQSDQETNSL